MVRGSVVTGHSCKKKKEKSVCCIEMWIEVDFIDQLIVNYLQHNGQVRMLRRSRCISCHIHKVPPLCCCCWLSPWRRAESVIYAAIIFY